MDSCSSLSKLLDSNRLKGPNFNEWLKNLRIVLCLEKIDYVLDNPPVKEVQEGATEEEKIAADKWKDDNYRAWFYMLTSMTNLLQKQHVNTESAYEILLHLQETYAELCAKRFSISKKLFSMRLCVESSFEEHVRNMVSYIQQLEELGASMSKDLAVDLILQSLPKSFLVFFMDHNLNKGDYDLSEFVSMLITFSAEAKMKKAKGSILGGSSVTKTVMNRKTKPKSEVGIKKAPLKPNSGIKKAHLKVKGEIKKKKVMKPSVGVAKYQLKSVGSIEINDCSKEGQLKKVSRVDAMPIKSIEKSEPEVVDCQGKGFYCDKEGQLKKVDIMPTKSIEKSEPGDVKCRIKCFRCGKKEGHIAKDCRADILPTKTFSAQENPNDWHMWKKPDYGWIKLNTDGCRKGYGGLFRDHEGKPLSGYIVRSSEDDIFATELFAVLRGISLAYQQGIKVLWVESDSLCVVNAVRGEQSCPHKIAPYLDQILQLIGLFHKFQISHCWRECNQAADHLSKMDYRVYDVLVNDAVLSPNDFPEILCKIIKEDAGGRLYYRQTSKSTCQTAANVLVSC